jgi:hypothetical protein
VSVFKEVLRGDEKYFEFVTKRLRGARDIFSKGGHVVSIYKDQKFRMYHDNRREIIEHTKFKGNDLSDKLLDSKPLISKGHALEVRFLSKFPFMLSFNKQDSSRVKTAYINFLEVGVRNFIKGFVSKTPYFWLRGTEFKYSHEIISFISEFDSSKEFNFNGKNKIKISRQSISNLKNRKLIWRPVPWTPETETFANYIKSKIPHFNKDEFLRRIL